MPDPVSRVAAFPSDAGSADEVGVRLPSPARVTLDCLAEASLVIDAAETVLGANMAYETLTGFAEVDLRGRPLNDFVERDRASAAPDSVLCRRHDAPFLALRAVVRRLVCEEPPNLQLVRLENPDERRSLVRDIGAGLEVNGEFLARISHELRTPLTAMQEGIGVVLDELTGPLNEGQREFLELARRNVQRLSRLVTDTLELDILKRGGRLRPVQPVDLMRLVHEFANPSRRVETVAALEPLWVEIDATGIRDALEKIVQNALQYSGNSAVRVELSRIGGEALVVVADSGPGIPADKLADIFGEFEQLSVGPGRTVGGVGLGLAIAKLMVEQHGGRIWAESELGRGSRFYVALKLSRPPVEKYP